MASQGIPQACSCRDYSSNWRMRLRSSYGLASRSACPASVCPFGTHSALLGVFERFGAYSSLRKTNRINGPSLMVSLHTGGVVGSIHTAPTISLRSVITATSPRLLKRTIGDETPRPEFV